MTKTLFSLHLRIGTELVDLPVYEDDSNHQLLERFCDHESVKKEFRKILNQKLKDSLLHILDNKQLDQELKEKVQKFVLAQILPKTNNRIEAQENKSKKLESRGEWVRGKVPLSSDTSHQNVVESSFSSRIPQFVNEKKLLKIPEVRKNNLLNSNKSPTASKQIIAAYETVYNKCRDPELKEMISKTLDDLQKNQASQNLSDVTHAKITPVDSIAHTYQVNPEQVLYQTSPKCNFERRSPIKWQSRSIQTKSKSGGKYDEEIKENSWHHRSLNPIPNFQTVLPRSKSRKRYNYLVNERDYLY